MARVTSRHAVDDWHRGNRASPRDDWLLREGQVEPGRFACEHGPFAEWERVVTSDGVTVTETVTFRLDVWLWRPLLSPLIRHYVKTGPRSDDTVPWWAPPDRLDARAARTISLLTIAVLAGAYLGTLLSQTISFVADEFNADRSTQGLVTGMTRVGALLAVFIVWMADRRGRRRLLLAAGAGATVFAALTALAPNIWLFGATQTLSRGLATGFGLLVAVAAAEESPAGSRAWITSVLALVAGLGSGMVLWLVPVADSGERAWRVLFVVALLALPVLWFLRDRLEETRRYERHHAAGTEAAPITALMRRRFAMLAAVGFALSTFSAPSSNFQTEYLRDERGFSGTRIGLYSTAVSTPIGLGVAVAGPIADRRGRRLVGIIGIIGGVGFAVMRYGFGGPLMWIGGVLSTVIGAAAIPALGVYGPELFPTSRRAMANGLLTCVSVVGGIAGLWFVGTMSEQWSFGRTFALLAIVPALATLVVARYPRTARRALEELNPEDE